MASTSGRMQGNNVTIGGQTVNFYFIDWQIVAQYPASNQTVINWQNYFYYTNSDAQLDDGDATVFGQLVYDVPGRVKNFTSTFVTRSHPISSGQITVTHATNGTFTGSVSGSIGGSLSARSGGSTSFTLPSYDRTPTVPSLTATNRNSDGTSFTTTSWSGSVNNSGPAVTWTIQRATNSAFTTGVTDGNSRTVSGQSLTIATPVPNQTYYIRIKASNSVETKYSNIITVNGVPSAPTSFTATANTTSSGKIDCTWVAPTNTQGGITGYNVYVEGTQVNTSNITGTSFSITTINGTTPLTPGTTYEIYVVAKNAVGFNNSTSYSRSSSLSRMAPGVPLAPSSIPTFTVNGLDITVTSSAVSSDNGIAISTGSANQGYYLQYQTSTTLDGTYGAWSTPVKMSDQTNRRHTLQALTPALFYKFRVYAANTVIYASNGSTQLYYPHNDLSYTANFATTTTGYFLAAGGRRWTGTEWVPTAIAKRWDGTQWVAFTIAKRWNGSEWVNLS
jgi:hypothetical protein